MDPGEPFQCLYSGDWSELGSTEDKGIPPFFSSFSYFYSFVLRFSRISRLQYGQSLGSRALTSNGVSRVNIGSLITAKVTSRHTSVFFQNGGKFLVRYVAKDVNFSNVWIHLLPSSIRRSF